MDEVENRGWGEAIADQIGTILIMKIELLATSSLPPRQEQHEDETAFWVGAIAIFTRYFRNHETVKICKGIKNVTSALIMQMVTCAAYGQQQRLAKTGGEEREV